MADAEHVDRIVVDATTEVGSERLAAALAAHDVAAIGQALRHDFVVVPMVPASSSDAAEGSRERQVRVFPPHEANAEKPYVLALFSSTATLAAYLADSPVREFDLRRGTSLEPFLRANLSSLERVYFDPAGPHAMQASPEDVLWSLQPTPSDDEVAWSAGEVAAPVQDELRTVGMDVPLSREWFVITLNDEPKRNREIDELVSRQLKTIGAAPVLRQELAKWLRASCARAASAGGRFQAYLLQRNEKTALALSLTMYWQDLGPALGDGHLDAMTRKLRGELGDGELLGAETEAGPFVRHTRQVSGAAEVGGEGTTLLVADYWLEFPDKRGLCLLSFSSPHTDIREQLLLLTDNIVLNAAWVQEEMGAAGPRG